MASSAGELYGVFISHASEDTDTFARPLADQLRRRGLRVWFDEFELTVGDSLRRNIDNGLAKSRYAVVVLSPAFFAKEWTKKELDALVARYRAQCSLRHLSRQFRYLLKSR